MLLLVLGLLLGCAETVSEDAYSRSTPESYLPEEVFIDFTSLGYAQGQLKVGITVTTHTIDNLDTYDLKELTTLVSEGKEYKPVAVPDLMGHHNSGELVFELPKPDSYKITIAGLPDSTPKVFQWP